MSQAKHIIQRSSIYAFGNVLRGLASFIMLPVYTRYLSPKDYGVIELISVALDLLLLLLGARVAVGIFKFYSDANNAREKNQVIGTALVLMGGVHLTAVFFIVAFNSTIATILKVDSDFGLALSVYSISAVFSAVNEVFYSYLKIHDRAYSYVALNMLRLVLQLALNIVLIAHFDMKYWGVIWSAVISAAVTTLLFSLWILPTTGLHVSRRYVAALTQFSAPIILSSLAMYYITFSSRYYLQYIDDINAVGVYAIANKFGMMIFSLVAVPFSEYWSARQFDIAKAPEAGLLFGHVFFYLNFVLLAAACALIATVSDLVHLIATPPFWTAIPIIPWLIGAYVLQCWGDYFRFGCFQTSNNRFITYASFATVVAITILYSIWIPLDGALGAAKALCVANAVRFFIIYFFAQPLFYIPVAWNRVAACAAYFALFALGISTLSFSGFAALAVKGGLVAVAVLIALFTPLIPVDHRNLIRREINKTMVARKSM